MSGDLIGFEVQSFDLCLDEYSAGFPSVPMVITVPLFLIFSSEKGDPRMKRFHVGAYKN